jgi:hypothetical protein
MGRGMRKTVNNLLACIKPEKTPSESEFLRPFQSPLIIGYIKGQERYYNDNQQLHRVGKPAVIQDDGHSEWWFEGRPHRADGPAVTKANGCKEWWWQGQQLSQAAWKEASSYLKRQQVLKAADSTSLQETLYKTRRSRL